MRLSVKSFVCDFNTLLVIFVTLSQMMMTVTDACVFVHFC